MSTFGLEPSNRKIKVERSTDYTIALIYREAAKSLLTKAIKNEIFKVD
jgi:hypothetical protein